MSEETRIAIDIIMVSGLYLVIGFIIAAIRDWEGDPRNHYRGLPEISRKRRLLIMVFWPYFWAKLLIDGISDFLR